MELVDAPSTNVVPFGSAELERWIFGQIPNLEKTRADEAITARVYAARSIIRSHKRRLLPLAYHSNHQTQYEVYDEHCFVWVGEFNQLVIRRKGGKYTYIGADALIKYLPEDDLKLLALYAQGKTKKAARLQKAQLDRIRKDKAAEVPIWEQRS